MKRWTSWVGKANWEDVKEFYVLDTVFPAVRRNGRWVWSTDFCTKKKVNLHRLSLLNSSVRVWNSLREKYLNKPISVSLKTSTFSFLCSFALNSHPLHLPFQSCHRFKLMSFAVRLLSIQLQQVKVSLPESENQGRYMDVSATALAHSQPAVSTDRESFPKPQTWCILFRVK